MNISFYNAASGMLGYQKDMDVLANNMANINTAGYKVQRSNFAELIYTNMDVNNNDNKVMGHGTRLDSLNLINTQGMLQLTERPLDFAINGNGMFAVELANGDMGYTRNGCFQISVEGSKKYLVTNSGEYVLDAKKKPIEIKENADGTGYDFSTLQDEIGVFRAENPFGLIPIGGSTFIESDNTGKIVAAEYGEGYALIVGALEGSNVSVSDEMVNVIQTQRAFQLNAKLVKVSDEIEEIVNTLR